MTADHSNNPPFPWHLGVYDAHCHPTDTMSSISTIQNMKTRVLTVMATRAEDQDLVISAAKEHGIKASDPALWSREECIVPCFGWHPWFAHQMYISDDTTTSTHDGEEEIQHARLTSEAKIAHYQKVLHPHRPDPLSPEDRTTFLSLPDPTSFPAFLATMKTNLLQHPYALVGETGLDRAFRIPESWSTTASAPIWAKRDTTLTPGGREGRRLTPFRCGPAHQKAVFVAQLRLAAELGRGVSVHGVQAHGLVYEALSELWKGCEREVVSRREQKKRGQDHPSVEADIEDSSSNGSRKVGENVEKKGTPFPPRICLHSYSGNASNFKQYLNPAIPARIFASFSTAINLSDAMGEETPKAFADIISAVPDHMLLVESDLHIAGEEMDKRLEDIVRRICTIKGWGLEEGVERLGRNWRAFVFGDES
ncbi:Metallo-dependent hydrolase [Pyrenochaeta sp. DS3sAY3a]|nr:Metallo-dependent hydrolase [Pyrenochaeta sp. DS3sAY3a]